MSDFFGKLKDGFGKGMTTASVRSKELLDSNKVKGQIEALEKQKRACLEELGNIVFTMYAKNAFNEVVVNDKCANIQKINLDIEEKNKELLEIRASADSALGKPVPLGMCPCGAEFYETTKFCGGCGKPVGISANNQAEGVSQ